MAKIDPREYISAAGLSSLLCILAVLCFSETASALDVKSQESGGLFVSNGKISMNAKDVFIHDVLKQIKDRCNLRIEGIENIPRENINIYFNELSVEASLKRLLKSVNYSLTYNSHGRPTGVVIISEKELPGISISNGRSDRENPIPFNDDKKKYRPGDNINKQVAMPQLSDEEPKKRKETFLEKTKPTQNTTLPPLPPGVSEEELQQRKEAFLEKTKPTQNTTMPGLPIGVSDGKLEKTYPKKSSP